MTEICFKLGSISKNLILNFRSCTVHINTVYIPFCIFAEAMAKRGLLAGASRQTHDTLTQLSTLRKYSKMSFQDIDVVLIGAARQTHNTLIQLSTLRSILRLAHNILIYFNRTIKTNTGHIDTIA